MNKGYSIEWTVVAEGDLRRIIDHIAIDHPGNARQILSKIREKASNLYDFPERGRIVPELRTQGIDTYRELIVSPWRIVYRISGRSIYVLSVFDGRRNIEDVLLDRLL